MLTFVHSCNSWVGIENCTEHIFEGEEEMKMEKQSVLITNLRMDGDVKRDDSKVSN